MEVAGAPLEVEEAAHCLGRVGAHLGVKGFPSHNDLVSIAWRKWLSNNYYELLHYIMIDCVLKLIRVPLVCGRSKC